ncbi:heterokaryon incompatibility protein-domain-containing protein [Clohesyomyces aquaticus]|uniref:Heterokaryon incompatibility protein-domain-containing protein n=1 Tax=Clohesyomyces aquaticus TaxID=1231657 RepID=A0A1Y1Z2Q8_9PLEO|nr:heterokaryon incompatibility protein-domain-containing protein [Clohesyomyces aquaticus]
MALEPMYPSTDLDLGRQEIRLVELLDGSESETISLRFHRRVLDDSLDFTALSYMWGDPDETRTILLDGTTFVIRENLWQFLSEVRRQGTYRKTLLWIDAICINQGNIRERNHQVELMGDLYSKATLVAAWLGVAGNGSDVAMDLLNRRFCNSCEASHRIGFHYISYRCLERTELSTIEVLLSRPYWRRVWITQEVILAKRVVLHCGQRLFEIPPSNEECPAPGLIWDSVGTIGGSILDSRRNWHQQDGAKGGFDFVTMARTSAWLQSSDVRDRIYALKGLLHPSELSRFNISVDYHLSPAELYMSLTEALEVAGLSDYDFRFTTSMLCIIFISLKRKGDVEMSVPENSSRQRTLVE